MDTTVEIYTTSKCNVCDNHVEVERFELGLDVCKTCAFQINEPRRYAKNDHLVGINKLSGGFE